MAQLSIMIKPASAKCNLQCLYCFYKDESMRREVADFGIMSTDTFDNLLAKALRQAEGQDIWLTFQGGEPLIAGKDFFRYVIAKTANLSNIHLSVQTNATLIDDEWAEIFLSGKLLVGVSLDGNKRTNKYRINAGGINSFYNVINGVNILKLHNVEFNVLIVATHWVAENIVDIYAFFKKNKMGYLQFIPCLASLSQENSLAMSANQYGKMLVQLFELYKHDFISGEYISVRYFDNLVNLAKTGRIEQCGLGGVCSRQYVIEANGNVYPCDFFCMDDYLLGNINTNSFTDLQSASDNFISVSAPKKQECASCPYFALCRGGGCKRERLTADYCEAYKFFFSKHYNDFFKF